MAKKTPFKLGLTGTIGSGKTTVASLFNKLGIRSWNADMVVEKLYKKNNAGYNLISKLLPETVTSTKVNKSMLKIAIFEKKIDLKDIEKLIHPLVELDRNTFEKKNISQSILVFEIPLLYENELQGFFDAVLVLTCNYKTQKERVLTRKNTTEKDFNFFLSKQMPSSEMIRKADFCIDTGCNMVTLEDKIINLIKEVSK